MGKPKTVMMKKYVLFSVCLFFINSCIVVPKGVIKSFNYCFDGTKKGLDTLFNSKGFYYIGDLNDNISVGEYIFYDNGFLQSGHALGQILLERNYSNIAKYGNYGSYRISKDTIKSQIISNPSGMGVYSYKVWFKIIDSNAIELIYWGHSNKITKKDIEKFKNKLKSDDFYKKRGTTFKFHPLKSKPDINKSYIMNKKWFWCNKEDFKNWKRKNEKQ